MAIGGLYRADIAHSLNVVTSWVQRYLFSFNFHPFTLLKKAKHHWNKCILFYFAMQKSSFYDINCHNGCNSISKSLLTSSHPLGIPLVSPCYAIPTIDTLHNSWKYKQTVAYHPKNFPPSSHVLSQSDFPCQVVRFLFFFLLFLWAMMSMIPTTMITTPISLFLYFQLC